MWRHAIHADPEIGFNEKRTAAFVAARLREIGITEVAEGIGGTGIVATLRAGTSSRSVALRADMDALQITEKSGHAHCSRNAGLMHACGHDGHIAMLLGAAKMLAQEPVFDGTVRFIFQPAEEWGHGAQSMLDDGLLERFPFDEIYGFHNWPGIAAGRFEALAGPAMSAEDNFEIIVTGVGGHASKPHDGRETLVAACNIVLALQTIVSRRVSPTDVAVVSVTQLLTDGVRNVLPGEARIIGDARSYNSSVSKLIEEEMTRIARAIGEAHGCSVGVRYTREFIPLINDRQATEHALAAAGLVFGPANVTGERAPVTVSEDFARFLEHVPGCFGFIGNGMESKPLHNPNYDFNDAILTKGAAYLAAIARLRLSRAQQAETSTGR